MADIETNARKIVSRLIRDGWVQVDGAKHDKFVHPDRRGVLMIVPRHRELSKGTARSIAKAAGWI